METRRAGGGLGERSWFVLHGHWTKNWKWKVEIVNGFLQIKLFPHLVSNAHYLYDSVSMRGENPLK